jgi:Rod binding domain-containing protein
MSSISPLATTTAASPNLEATFRQVVGNVFYGQLLKSLRQSVGKPAYIHGGQAEDLFQSQLDQYVVEDLAGRQSGPWMDELFQQFQQQLNQRMGVLSAAQPSQLARPAHPFGPAPLAELREAARQTQPAPEGAGMTTGTAALSALIRK